MIHYEITKFDTDTHEFHIRLRLPVTAGQQAIRLSLPAWIPGSYMIRDFARNVTSLAAFDCDGPLHVEKSDKQTWLVGTDNDEITVEYRVYAFDLSVRTAYLDRTRAYFNGTSLFLQPDDAQDADWQFVIHVPDPPQCEAWRVATTLPAAHVDDRGFGSYRGRGYARLIDCPVEIGVFERASFSVAGVPHEIVISDAASFDLRRIVSDLVPICSEHSAMFGDLPVEKYLFLTLATAEGYGGLEHKDSTSLICKRADLPRDGLAAPDKGYRQFLGLCSHEYFHLWNVKRIRPARLAEADLSAEVYTELLWAFEGITSYYDELALARSRVLTLDAYLDLFATTVTRVLRGAGRHRQSIAESSFDAWTRFYKQDENAPNAIVSYYAKGALVAFGLDVTIRELSSDRLSLDDLMRALWREFGRRDVGVPERGIEKVLSRLLDHPVDDFFERFVYGVDELPLADWFAKVGVGYRVRAATSDEDQGGCRIDPPEDARPRAFGARFNAQADGLVITHVLAQGAAQAAGLAAGDALVAFDGERVTVSNLPDLLLRATGDSVDVHFFRRGRLLCETFPILSAAEDTCDLWVKAEADLSADVRDRRASWLKTSQGRVT